MAWLDHLAWLLTLTSVLPLLRAWRANRQTSLLHAVQWAMVAWAGWLLVSLLVVFWSAGRWTAEYIALALTGCAGVAVLGARRPGVAAWNFVVLGLLAVQLLQVGEGLEKLRTSPLRLLFLGGTVLVGVLNYLATRAMLGALALAAGLGIAFLELLNGSAMRSELSALGRVLIGVSPWLAHLGGSGAAACPSEMDRVWLGFRERFGVVWALRVRDQFNRSAAHNGWPVQLTWRGLGAMSGMDEKVRAEMLTTLRALLKRFGPEESIEGG